MFDCHPLLICFVYIDLNRVKDLIEICQKILYKFKNDDFKTVSTLFSADIWIEALQKRKSNLWHGKFSLEKYPSLKITYLNTLPFKIPSLTICIFYLE